MKLTFSLITVFLFFVCLSPAQDKARDWQTGKVLDTDSSSYRVSLGSTTQVSPDGYGGANATTTNNSATRRQEVIAIEGAEYIYVSERTMRARWTKSSSLTVNAEVKYAVEKDKIYIVDDNGREIKLTIKKRILKEKK